MIDGICKTIGCINKINPQVNKDYCPKCYREIKALQEKGYL